MRVFLLVLKIALKVKKLFISKMNNLSINILSRREYKKNNIFKSVAQETRRTTNINKYKEACFA